MHQIIEVLGNAFQRVLEKDEQVMDKALDQSLEYHQKHESELLRRKTLPQGLDFRTKLNDEICHGGEFLYD